MGESKRRADFRATKQQMIDKEKIAFAIQADVFVSIGGTCAFRNALGQLVLRELGISSRIIAGAALYRAGPCETRDVVAYCGYGNAGMRDPKTGRLIGHYYLKAGNDLIDFSPADWRRESEVLTSGPFACDDLGEMVWQVEPPPFYWGGWSELTASWQSEGTPPIGEVWYGGWGYGARPNALPREIYDMAKMFLPRVMSRIHSSMAEAA